MTILPSKADWPRRWLPVLLTLILSAPIALAGATDEIQAGVLAAGDKIYTNAIITRVTPAYAVVSYQDGLVQIPMSNMPAVYQTQFGYSPQTAVQFLDEEKQAQQKRRAASLAQQAAFQRMAGTNRPVRIIAIDDDPSFGGYPCCSVYGIKGGILIENFPGSVRQFMSGYGRLKADIADCQQQFDRLKALTNSPPKPAPPPQMGKSLMIGNGAGFARVVAPKDNTPVIRQETADRLDALNAQLKQETANYNLYTTIIAHPSGQSYVGRPIWICVGVPAAAAAR
jgi:hypothetical protein